mgnify:CR=1 FL=1
MQGVMVIHDTGEFIRGKRLEAGYTMQEAAERMGVSMALLSRVEHGMQATGSTFNRMCKLYHIDDKERSVLIDAFINGYRTRKYKKE